MFFIQPDLQRPPVIGTVTSDFSQQLVGHLAVRRPSLFLHFQHHTHRKLAQSVAGSTSSRYLFGTTVAVTHHSSTELE